MCRRLLYRISLRQSHQNGRLLWVIVWLGAVANFTAEPQSSDDWEIEKASKNVRLSGGCNRMRHIMIYFYLLTFECFFTNARSAKGRHEAKYAPVSQFVMDEKNSSRISMLAKNNGEKDREFALSVSTARPPSSAKLRRICFTTRNEPKVCVEGARYGNLIAKIQLITIKSYFEE